MFLCIAAHMYVAVDMPRTRVKSEDATSRSGHRSFSKLMAVVGLLISTFGSATAVHAAPPPNIGLEEIVSRLAQWRASFVNLRSVWELRSLPETDEAVAEWASPPDAGAGALFAREEWIWADHGLDLLEGHFFPYPDGGSKIHSVEVFNGPKDLVFRAAFQKPPGGPEQFTDLLLRGSGTGKPESHKARAPLEGLYWPGYAAWLPEMLSKWTWKVEEIETIDGEPCARITSTLSENGDVGITEILWLALNHDCLVRRRTTPAVPGRTTGGDFIVDEFQRLDGGNWFPKRGRKQLGGTPHENQLFVVTEAAVNESLDLARFEPPVPAVGTAVDDNGRAYTHGGPGAPTTAEAAKVGDNESAWSGMSAAPPTSSWPWWSGALIGVSVVFLTVGFWFSNRKKEVRS